ncbi:pancreatic secretory granule membrane major glycoprotein GP2-like isoform X2 [Hyperolius riggenbachi]|uniref:pancreatic secretory granule membrane major glycoprotein GP2-like isoform X2 n=1 Tax=Hyperolius riggenbachi TaxID=752182 RepID=UPI0035A3B36C
MLGGEAQSQCYSGSNPPICGTCGGSCTSDNHCFCGDEVTLCIPTTECLTVPYEVCCPNGLYWDADNICCSSALSCNPPCYEDETCIPQNGAAVCQCNNTFYAGKTTNDLSPIVTCGPIIMIFALNKCLLQALGYDSTSYKLINDSKECGNTYVDTDGTVETENIQVEVANGWCGNVVNPSSVFVSYTNWVHISPYYTGNILTYPVTCSYIDGSASVTGFGLINTTAQIFSDAGFQNAISSGAPVSLGTYVYFQLTLVSPIVDGYVLRAENCYATPFNDKDSSLRVNLVVGGCAADEGVDTVVIQNGVSTDVKMEMVAFRFTGYPLVYMFCDVSLCLKSDKCTQCNTGRALDTDLQTFQAGFFSATEDKNLSSSGSLTAVSWSLLTTCFILFTSIVSLYW